MKKFLYHSIFICISIFCHAKPFFKCYSQQQWRGIDKPKYPLSTFMAIINIYQIYFIHKNCQKNYRFFVGKKNSHTVKFSPYSCRCSMYLQGILLFLALLKSYRFLYRLIATIYSGYIGYFLRYSRFFLCHF